MKRIFIDQLTDDITFTGEIARHLGYSLRSRVGDRFEVVDALGSCAEVELIQFDRESVKARRVGEIIQLRVERPITLACCLPKQNKFDIIVEKATELGVSRLVPLISDRTITRPSEVREHSKRERWARIIREAAEQSGRNTLPFLDRIKDLSEWLEEVKPTLANENSVFLFCNERERETYIKSVVRDIRREVIILIGPEGSFSDREVRMIKDAGAISVSLGSQILKVDTAALSTLAIIRYELNG